MTDRCCFGDGGGTATDLSFLTNTSSYVHLTQLHYYCEHLPKHIQLAGSLWWLKAGKTRGAAEERLLVSGTAAIS